MKRIPIRCPECSATKLQKLPESLMERRNMCEKGIIAILVPENTICPHGFLVYVDQNFSIRDYVTISNCKDINKKRIICCKDIDEIVTKLKPTTIKNILQKL